MREVADDFRKYTEAIAAKPKKSELSELCDRFRQLREVVRAEMYPLTVI